MVGPVERNEVDPLEIAACHLVAGDLRSEDLPDLASDALVRGVDSPSLRVLAGQERGDVRESRDLFIRTLTELNISLPDTDDALWELTRSTARAIVAGTQSPASGAEYIWRTTSYDVNEGGDLRIFIGLASELQDHPEGSASLERLIVAAAEELLLRPTPRHWINVRASLTGSPVAHSGHTGHTDVMLTDEPISSQLVADLEAWNSVYRAVLEGWPDMGGFRSELEARRFVADGLQLAARLQDELGPSHHVEYSPEPVRLPGLKLLTRGRRRR